MNRLLFSLFDWVEKEAGQFLNEKKTIVDAIDFVKAWTANREELKNLSATNELKVFVQKHRYECITKLTRYKANHTWVKI